MKLILFALMALMTLQANAASNVCSKFFTCGVYLMNWSDANGAAQTTRITIKETGENTASFDYVPQTGQPWHLSVQFQENGVFTMTDNGLAYTAGICSDQICTYGMHSWHLNGEVIANSGMLRFNGDKLEYYLIYGVPSSIRNELQLFTLQPPP
jgi:hypothetical protein